MDLDQNSDFTHQQWSIDSPWPAPTEDNFMTVWAFLTLTKLNVGYHYDVVSGSSLSGFPSNVTYHYAVNIAHKNGLFHRFYLTGIDSCNQFGNFLGWSKIDYVELQLL
jgi:hypothetical protein